jgi:hypothetical protein
MAQATAPLLDSTIADIDRLPRHVRKIFLKVGDKGITTGDTIGCPNKKDYETLLTASASAREAKDDVGSTEALVNSALSGCGLFKTGEKVLIIEMETFGIKLYGTWQPLYRIRLASNSKAYWASTSTNGPLN